ncbi:MAG: hypothetical protein ACO3YO_01695 [Chthoniobacterales bacterium]|jgi:hypothetical protein
MSHAPTSTGKSKSIWPMFVGAFAIFAVFAVLVQWLLNTGNRQIADQDAARAKERVEILKIINDENAALTTGYGWADRAKGTVRIPLDRAMEMAVARLSAQGEPRPADAIDPNIPLGSAVKPGGLAAAQPTPPPFSTPPPAAAPAEVTPAVEPPAASAETPPAQP